MALEKIDEPSAGMSLTGLAKVVSRLCRAVNLLCKLEVRPRAAGRLHMEGGVAVLELTGTGGGGSALPALYWRVAANGTAAYAQFNSAPPTISLPPGASAQNEAPPAP